MRIIKKTLQAIVVALIPTNPFIEQDWLHSIIKTWTAILDFGMKELKDLIVICGELYHWGSGGVLAWSFLSEAKEEL